MSILPNLQSFNPFADAAKGDDLLPAGTEDYIHIRIQQWNGRKTLTTVQGTADDYAKRNLWKLSKRSFPVIVLWLNIWNTERLFSFKVTKEKTFGNFTRRLALSKRKSLRFMDSKMNLHMWRISWIILFSDPVWLPWEIILCSKWAFHLFNHSNFHSHLHDYRKHGVHRLVTHKKTAVRW